MPIKKSEKSIDPSLATTARDQFEKMTEGLNLERVEPTTNLDSRLRPEDPYTKIFRRVVPWSKGPRRR